MTRPVDQDRADAIASALRAAGAAGSVEGVVRATAEQLSDWDLEGSLPSDRASIPLPLVEPRFRDAIGSLYSLVLAAEPAVRDAASGADERLLSEVLSVDPRDRAALRHLHSRAEGVDTGAMASIAASIAAAIDDLLVTAPATSGSEAEAAAECDVLDLRPNLCVGGDQRNTYTSDPLLLIDLGGDDVYRGGGGVGACLAGSVFTPRCVGVVVDLGGDDEHRAQPGNCGTATATCGQGTGVIGLGMLVDAQGDDSYATIGTVGEPAGGCLTETKWCGSVAGQGTGGLGIGILADLLGNDSYLAAFEERTLGPDGFEASQAVSAQGAGLLGGGMLWDAAGSDSYEMQAFSTGRLGEEHEELMGQEWQILGGSGFVGQGAALAGPGALLDGGGDDRLRVRAAPAPEAGASSQTAPTGQGGSADAAVQGFGEAFAQESWVGALVTGPGDTEYTADLSGRLGAYLQAQGSGLFGDAHGLIDDAGGDDRYTMSAAAHVEFAAVCACPVAEAVLDLNQDSFISHFGVARPMALGQGGPLGSVHDRGGNDVYRAAADSKVEVRAVNTRPGGAARAGVLLVGEVTLQPRQYAGLVAQGAPGPLRDDAGDDRYVIDVNRSVRASASAVPAAPGEVANERAWAFPGTLIASGQGIGLGKEIELEDRGGSDSYIARYTASGDAVPEAPGTEGDGVNFLSVQGVDGLLSDLDAGETDSFAAEGSLVFDTCIGRYGEGPGWVSGPTLRNGSCSPTWGVTEASSTVAAGADTELTFLSWTPGGDEEFPAYDVELRLTDTGGNPLPGRRVVVVADHGATTTDPLVDQLFPWVNATLSSQHLVTDANGVARGTMPMRLLGCEGGCEGLTGDVRLRGMFFGEPGAYRPAQGTTPVMPG